MTIPNSWITELNIIINNTGDIYTDDEIKNMLIVGANYVNTENNFTTSYTIDVQATSIAPTPDGWFSRLTIAKTACLVDQSTLRNKSLPSGMKARMGQAVLETTQHAKSFSDIASFSCEEYKNLQELYGLGNNTTGRTILSPFTSNNYFGLR